jgi:hypothetical protein
MSCGLCVCLVGLALLCVKAADDNDVEMKKVEGRYERFVRNQAGVTFRTVKEEFANGQSIVTTYDDVGNVVVAHTATFKVEKRGTVRVFSFFNLTVIAGPQKGHTEVGTNSFIYRVDDESFTEVYGLLEGDPNPPLMIVWKRIKEAP